MKRTTLATLKPFLGGIAVLALLIGGWPKAALAGA